MTGGERRLVPAVLCFIQSVVTVCSCSYGSLKSGLIFGNRIKMKRAAAKNYLGGFGFHPFGLPRVLTS